MQNPNLPTTAEQNRGNNLDLPQIGLHARPQAFKSQSSEAKRNTHEWVFLPQLNGEAIFVGSVCMNDGSEWVSDFEWFLGVTLSDFWWARVTEWEWLFNYFLVRVTVKGEWVSEWFWVIFGSDTEWFLVSKLNESDWVVFGKESVLIWMGVTLIYFLC